MVAADDVSGGRTSVTVVTGASTGIGRAVAVHAAERGHLTYALVRNPESAVELHEAGIDPSVLRIQRIDVTDDASVAERFEAILGEHGRIDNFVNNAGIYLGAPLEDTSMDQYREMVDTNFLGAVRCLKQVVPGMRERGAGAIVAVTSQSARVIFPTWTAYSASKAALEAALEALAMEVAPFGIRVAMIEPGHVRTAMKHKIQPRKVHPAYNPLYERYDTIVAANRSFYIDPEPVAEVVWKAIVDPSTPLRVPVGVDSERHTRARPFVSDRDWTSVFAIADDDEFYETWSGYVGSEDPRTRQGIEDADPVAD